MTKLYEFSNNLGYVDDKVPDDVYKIVLEEIETAFNLKHPHNTKLVGNIEEQYYMEFNNQINLFKLETYLRGLAGKYEDKFKYMSSMANQSMSLDEGMSFDLRLRNCWVNYMKKYEFNPLHNHSGLYSFVIFIKIPYYLKDEFNSLRTQNISQRYPGCFTFYTGNGVGEICPHVIQADKEWEKVILLFPSITQHCVYPFYTSDDYRISVSGNLYLNPVTRSAVSYY
tara:strand:+ start:543 stop:1220 length:678 start_codon:yes stop_codon:yes gene_type:complete